MLIAAGILIFATSCKKEQSTNALENQSKPVEIKDGMLVFRDTLVFREYYSKLLKPNGLKDDILIKNFASYKTILDKAQEEFSNISNQSELDLFLTKNSDKVLFDSKDNSIFSKYGNSILMSFINAEGRFMIGNQLQVLSKNNYITINNPTNAKINQALSTNISDSKQGISVHNKIISSKNSNSSINATAIANGVINEVTYYNEDGKRRLFVQLINEFDPGYGKNHLYLGIFQQKKGTFGGWSNNQTDLYFDSLSYLAGITRGIPYLPNFQVDSGPSNQSYYWQNVTGPVYYELGLFDTNNDLYLTSHYEELNGISLKGHFFSGGVPNTPLYNYN